MPSAQPTIIEHSHRITLQPLPTPLGPKDFLPILSSGVIAVATVVAVHRLTRRREREKGVFELQRSIVSTAQDLRTAVETGWTTTSAAKRKVAVADALWHLQRIGAMAEQMRRLSRGLRWLVIPRSLNLKGEVSELRDAITLGDFEDETRNAQPTQVPAARTAINNFVEKLEGSLYRWMA